MKYYQEFTLNVLGRIESPGSLTSTFVMDEIKHEYGVPFQNGTPYSCMQVVYIYRNSEATARSRRRKRRKETSRIRSSENVPAALSEERAAGMPKSGALSDESPG